ncbi:hypothetical protein HELRODRAFT_171340 [Helobdella robusta]|uniref:Uncharacterized protein n=1 Tax=Helobdella robusta TaxID=6412 RepID=T1F451_HELRO|nr:hypothetical protein HELRODRAFT_171340 [Helobdella robusta]ESO05680.1 hypothetical protein HELRODRAFT_171340 [Helobdella robusta]
MANINLHSATKMAESHMEKVEPRQLKSARMITRKMETQAYQDHIGQTGKISSPEEKKRAVKEVISEVEKYDVVIYTGGPVDPATKKGAAAMIAYKWSDIINKT